MKFKAGLLVGYNGEGYSGLQLNKDLNTIEKAIGDCLTQIGAISESNSSDYSKIHICSSSRTDKGVHAVLNLIVCKIQKEIDEDLQQDLFKLLQDKRIHLYKIIRLTKSFIPSKQTSYRTYEYVIPTYFLQESDFKSEINKEEILNKETEAGISYKETEASICNKEIEAGISNKETEASISKEETEASLHKEEILNRENIKACLNETSFNNSKNKKLKLSERTYSENHIKDIFGFRSSKEDLKIFSEIVSGFKGTKFYHNYTVLSNPKGKQRYIQKVDVSEPYVIDDVEYIRITLEGQSFLLHQIRKMTYFALLLTRYKRSNYTSVFESSFSDKLHIPKGPSQYLLLDRPHFMEVRDKGKMIDNLEVDETERLKFKEKVSELIHKKENLYRFLACLDSTRWYNEEMPYLIN